MRHFQSNTRAERRVLNCIDAFYTDTVAHWISVELSHLHACQITSREITMHNQTFLCTQIEVFYELNAAAVQSAARGEEHVPAGGTQEGGAPSGCVFKTVEDRAMLLAMLLHCADISNACKPKAVAEKCAWRLLPLFRRAYMLCAAQPLPKKGTLLAICRMGACCSRQKHAKRIYAEHASSSAPSSGGAAPCRAHAGIVWDVHSEAETLTRSGLWRSCT
jgi:hypothetical protein